MGKYKLIYFNAKGMGETIRWIFAATNTDYEDCRLEPKDWAAEKPKMPFGQLPVLEVDGKQLAQSKAICRYLARELKLTGASSWEEAQEDMIVDYVEDMRAPIIRIFHEKDEEKRKLQTQLFKEEQLPTFLKNFDKLLSDNGGGDGYFVGSKLTWCDIVFATMMAVMAAFAEKYNMEFSLDKFPKLASLVKRVEANEGIAAWIAKRPETAM